MDDEGNIRTINATEVGRNKRYMLLSIDEGAQRFIIDRTSAESPIRIKVEHTRHGPAGYHEYSGEPIKEESLRKYLQTATELF